ncbi:MAG: hypothetical protein MHM6MM_002841 [Cercozoa sp. M6MM]
MSAVGNEDQYGFGVDSRTYRPPQWRQIVIKDFDERIAQHCPRNPSPFSPEGRPQYAGSYVNETLMQQLAGVRSPLNESVPNSPDSFRSDSINFFLSYFDKLGLKTGPQCRGLGLDWICQWMAPRFVAVNLTSPHPVTGLDYELFRLPICMSTCDSMLDQCPEMKPILSFSGLHETCNKYTFSDIVFGARWSVNNPFLMFSEQFEAYARAPSLNVTQHYIDLDQDEVVLGWGNSSKLFDDPVRLQAWQDDLNTPVERNFTLSESAGPDLDQLRQDSGYGTDDYYFVRSVDGRRHALPCYPLSDVGMSGANACATKANVLSPRQEAEGSSVSCVLTCPAPFMTASQHDTLVDTRVATGAVTVVCAALVVLRLLFDNVRHRAMLSQNPAACRRPLLPPFPARLSLPLTLSFLLVGIAMLLQPQACADPAMPTTDSDSVCAAQASLFVFGAVSAVAWWAAFAVCLWGMLKDHKLFTSNRTGSTVEGALHAVCWLPALVCAVLPAALGRVRWNEGASMCSIETSDGVGLFVGVFIVPICLFMLIGIVAVVAMLVHVCTSERRSVTNSKRKSSSASVLIARFALFVPCFLGAAVITLVLELRRLAIPDRVEDALREATKCATDLTDGDLALNPGDLSRLDAGSCIDDAILNADTGVSYGAEILALVCWMFCGLVILMVFATPVQLVMRCLRRSLGSGFSSSYRPEEGESRRWTRSATAGQTTRTATEVELELRDTPPLPVVQETSVAGELQEVVEETPAVHEEEENDKDGEEVVEAGAAATGKTETAPQATEKEDSADVNSEEEEIEFSETRHDSEENILDESNTASAEDGDIESGS